MPTDRPAHSAPPPYPATVAHVLTVFNGIDVPDDTARQVMALLAPYAPDCYQRPCDAHGQAL